VFHAGIKGRGLRVEEDVEMGDFIIEYTGLAVKRRFLDDLFRRYRTEKMLYIMALDNKVYIDARKKGGVARYINHSCEPNCAVHRWKVRGVNRAGIFATRNIKAGDELAFDYKWKRKRGRAPTRCHCGEMNCRGTLEEGVAEEEEEEEEMEGQWKMPSKKTMGEALMNQTVKLYDEIEHDYFVADVCQFDPLTKKHCLIYKGCIDEMWEDLSVRKWMILDDDIDEPPSPLKQYSLYSSSCPSTPESPHSPQSPIARKVKAAYENEVEIVDGQGILAEHPSSATRQQLHKKMKQYVIVQTPMKEKLLARHAVDACQRFRVQINVSVLIRTGNETSLPPPTSEDYFESKDESEALESSSDGQAWKFNLTGLNPGKAREYLERDIAEIEKEERRRLVGKNWTNLHNDASKQKVSRFRHEIIIPKCVTDQVKGRLPILRNSCKNADVAFVTIKSKGYHFTKLVIESADKQFAYAGQMNLWKEVLTLLNACNAPKTGSGIFKNLVFLGGELSTDDFQLLFSLNLEGRTVSQEECEKYREFASLTHFETCHRCIIWVQAPEENANNSSRVDSIHRDTDKAKTLGNGMFKVFYGCEPTRIPELWGHVRSRLTDMRRGVKYWNMELDKDQLAFMIKSFDQKSPTIGSNFLEYVSEISGASVSIDQYCRYHIRIDGCKTSNDFNKCVMSEAAAADKIEADRRTNSAKEIIHLQIELLRENQARQHRRVFGRDWSHVINNTPQGELALNITSSYQSLGSNAGDNRDVVTAFMQIAEITDRLNLRETSVAAHACIILYRYLNIVSNQPTKSTHVMILRETFLACTFLANKAQKAIRWKRLEMLLDVAYKMFYGFVPNVEEAASWERRILTAENDIVTILEHDVFWPGIDWIATIAYESCPISASNVKTIVDSMQSGPILAAGQTLWLKLGPEYIFTAVAALLSYSIDGLLVALSMSPTILIDAVKLIIDSLLSSRQQAYTSKTLPEIINLGKDTLLQKRDQIEKMCNNHTLTSGKHNLVGMVKNHQVIAHQCGRRRVFHTVESRLIKDRILPSIGRIRLQSQCDVYFKEGDVSGTEDIILDGSWRSLALAEHLLKTAACDPLKQNLPGAAGTRHHLSSVSPEYPTLLSVELIPEVAEIASTVRIRGTANPCTIAMSSINLEGGWDKLGDHFWRGKAGGKSCIPANVSSKVLRKAGLCWRSQSTPCPTLDGALCSMISLKRSNGTDNKTHLDELSKIANRFHTIGEDEYFPFLSSSVPGNNEIGSEDEYICDPISLQRWPPEKVEIRERSKGGMGTGISASALQEMQLLQQLHFLIPAPQGHPNFVLPIAIATDDMMAKVDTETPNDGKTKNVNDFITGRSDDILSFLHSEKKDKTDQEKPKVRGSHLVFEPMPLVLQTIISKPKKGKNGKLEAGLVPASILTTWFHDLLSALAHCHENHVVLRTLHPDQIFIDHSGVAKISGLSRSIVLNHSDRGKYLDQAIPFKNGKGKKCSIISDDDILSNPYMAPELLLGGSRYSQETDVWTLGCMIAHLIVSKPIFSGRDRQSKMRSIFKIVGSPSSTNYKKAETFPHYNSCKTSKKYRSDVEKAIRFMLNSNGTDAKSYSKILGLLERILVLDPIKRITAAGALQHKSMTDYLNDTCGDTFRRKFVTDWVALNNGLCSSSDSIAVDRDDAIKHTISNHNRDGKRQSPCIRKDSAENTMDNLYDIDDMMPSYIKRKRVKLNGTS